MKPDQANPPATVSTASAVAAQAPDDYALLEMMMADLKKAPVVFQPTNYWATYEPRFMAELKAHGLKDFRRQKDAVFRAFGGVDFVHPTAELAFRNSRLFRNRLARAIPGLPGLAHRLDLFLSRYIKTLDGLDMATYVRLGYLFAEDYARGSAARPLSAFSMSLVGNPDGVVEIDGRLYTRQMIQYYLQYAYVSRFVSFDDLPVIAELGSGMGRQTEIFAKLHPNQTYLLFDIPPQIYVAEQYLKAVFGDRVVSYRENRDRTSLSNLRPGAIYIFGNNQMPLLETYPVDLFWNSASFHEMEPDVVQNYLRFVDASTRWVYLGENLKGGVKASKPGDFGILKVTRREDYVGGLPSFDLIDTSPTLRINGKPLADTNMMFRRKA